MSKTKLLPCPFCGGKATTWTLKVKFGEIVYVECDVCGAKSKARQYDREKGDDDEGAKRTEKAWNLRAQ